uniref:SMP-30/Gluconolactonase/LRE-like region domain-containing protein n=1 Tax=Emiliania huxleyi (strain CCMP1516) TaxID=280463 RepID=A0A0D3JAB5_EMIH1
MFVADCENHKIRRVEVATGEVTTVAGSGENGDADGVGEAAQFSYPTGIAISPDGSALFAADCCNYKIRRVDVATGAVTTIAGSGTWGSADGVGDAAEFHGPRSIAISRDGGALFVADQGHGKIRRVEVATGAVTTLAGSGTWGSADGVGDAAEFYCPRGIALSPDGGALFVADNGNHKIRRVEVATGEVTTLAGSGEAGSVDGVGEAAQFTNPKEVAISPDGSTLL